MLLVACLPGQAKCPSCAATTPRHFALVQVVYLCRHRDARDKHDWGAIECMAGSEDTAAGVRT